ncbi:MAG: ATP-dependent DNA helicase PcrA, DNA helicase II / ATP-dependent DNA helicase PcrA [Candidatus Peregrinibacteria bacterium GW2011_GWF2_38_29]|nr:MAG: ATP-dependent DNA helicase PcrA, DNA helicase II / ATP-dependent DNA helicase PcrA [Candidatus Peregrinibacteria bacterium GW2011_GWF2_38_29]HBB02902.1 hypothetical protein [Candidatus Peregrinibacteria bacterium]
MILNQNQDACVKHIDGPLLVVAGAGTGKTRVITNRILHLVQEKGIPTNRILALTFTEKAANEMTNRVDTDMPFGYEEIWIKTFHGFCDKILREKGIENGIDPNFKLLTKTQQWTLLKENFYDFEFEYYKPSGNNSGFIHTLLTHFSKLKDEYILPEEYKKFAEIKLAAAKDDLEKEEADKMNEIANAYEKYQEFLLQENAMDFGDLIINAIRLFEARKTVLNYFQDRFSYIMVDEFQDTNYAQTFLMLMLAGKHKNLVVVGDDDQAIYRWRGASLNNISMFKKAFPEAKFISLIQNYRNNQDILDASYSLIQNNNPERLEAREKISKKLQSEVGKDTKGSAEIWHFENYLHEANEIASYIDGKIKEGANPSDFAILGRTNGLLQPFIDELKSKQIPYFARANRSVVETSEARDLISILRVMMDKKDNTAIFRILQIPVFDIPMKDIFNFMNELNATHESYFNNLDEYGQKNKIDGLCRVYTILDELINNAKSKPVSMIFGEFLEKSGYIKFLTDNLNRENEDKIHNISAFSKIVGDFERENKNNYIGHFLDYLDLIEEAEIIESENDYEQEEGVKILTVHSAKGLEFKNVFVVNLVKNRFPGTNRSDQIETPDALLKEPLPMGDHHKEEERRLFYVACTRAKEKLFLTYSDKYEGVKKWEKSIFLEEVAKENKIEQKDFELKTEINISKPDFGDKIYKPKKKVGVHVSYSQLDTFNMCPLKYSYRYIISLPSQPSSASSFGTAVHDTLKDLYKMIMEGQEVSMEILQSLYEKNWVNLGYQSKAHENKQKQKGLEILTKYYEANSKPWAVPAFIERDFSLKIGPYMIKGRIDRIDEIDDGVFEIIDYKTGKSKRDQNVNKDIQLSIYTMACEEIYGIKIAKAGWYFLEDGERKVREKPADSAKTREEIIAMIKNIEESDFAPCEGFHCKFCDYKIVCPAWN